MSLGVSVPSDVVRKLHAKFLTIDRRGAHGG
jgi:hypothetical protein